MTDQHLPRIERLRGISLFGCLDDTALSRLATAATDVELPAGHVLIQPGNEGSGLFVVEEGTAHVELPGRTVECGPGEFVGELALLAEGVMHTVRVRAATPMRCLAISRESFDALLADEPRIAVAMLPVLARRLAETDRMLSGH